MRRNVTAVTDQTDSDGVPTAGRVWTGLLVVLLLVFAAACGGDDASDDTDVPEPPPTGDFGDYIGLTEQEAGDRADDEGRPWRVIEREGEQLPVTMDFVEDRLNFVIGDGVVTEVTTG